MLDNLTQRLAKVVKTMRGEARLTEANTAEMLREVRLALLEADVALPAVREFIANVKQKALGEEVISRMIADGSIIARPAQEDKEAMRLLRLLSIVSRRRWPDSADRAPAVGVPPPKKKAPAAPAPAT